MSKIIRSDRNDEALVDPAVDQGPMIQPLRLPPLRKFGITRVNPETGLIQTYIVVGHAIEPIGYSDTIAIVIYKQVGDEAIQTFSRIVRDYLDIEELTANALDLN